MGRRPMVDVLGWAMCSETEERVIKTTKRQRKDGFVMVEETILRRTFTTPVAQLSCGHERGNIGDGTDIRTAKKIRCFQCAKPEDPQQAEERAQSYKEIMGRGA